MSDLRYNLPSARSRWPAIYREEFEERAAIMEHEGGLPKEEAERKAEQAVRVAADAATRAKMGGK